MVKKPDKAPGMPQDATAAVPTAPAATDGHRRPWTAGRIAVRCTLDYATWAHGLGAWARIPTAEVLDQAVRRYADSLGYPVQQPPRLPSARPPLASYQLQADFRRSGLK